MPEASVTPFDAGVNRVFEYVPLSNAFLSASLALKPEERLAIVGPQVTAQPAVAEPIIFVSDVMESGSSPS